MGQEIQSLPNDGSSFHGVIGKPSRINRLLRFSSSIAMRNMVWRFQRQSDQCLIDANWTQVFVAPLERQ